MISVTGYENNPRLCGVTHVAGFARELFRGGRNPPIPAVRNTAIKFLQERKTMTTKFKSEVKTVPFGKGKIRIENLTPVLSPDERAKRKREVESRLYSVFSKYANKKKKL